MPQVFELPRSLKSLPRVVEQTGPEEETIERGLIPTESDRAVEVLFGIFRQQTGLAKILMIFSTLLENPGGKRVEPQRNHCLVPKDLFERHLGLVEILQCGRHLRSDRQRIF